MQELLKEVIDYLKMLPELGIKELYLDDKTKRLLTAMKSKEEQLKELKQEVLQCKRCSLWKTRHHVVFGEGNPDAPLVLVGEAPGRDEDLQGRPFVGAAGKLLDKMLEAIGLNRQKDVFICNILKCRPPGNRNPLPDEIEACLPFLVKQLKIISPKLICTLGSVATHTLLQTTVPISRLRGRVHQWQGIELIPTFHPAYLLRNPAQKRLAWEDLKFLRERLSNKI